MNESIDQSINQSMNIARPKADKCRLEPPLIAKNYNEKNKNYDDQYVMRASNKLWNYQYSLHVHDLSEVLVAYIESSRLELLWNRPSDCDDCTAN